MTMLRGEIQIDSSAPVGVATGRLRDVTMSDEADDGCEVSENCFTVAQQKIFTVSHVALWYDESQM